MDEVTTASVQGDLSDDEIPDAFQHCAATAHSEHGVQMLLELRANRLLCLPDSDWEGIGRTAQPWGWRP